MRTGLFDIEALGREPKRVGGRSASLTRARARGDRRRARDVSFGEVDRSGRDLEPTPRHARLLRSR
jgi:hypothetical protein